jgi:hypothetical protein
METEESLITGSSLLVVILAFNEEAILARTLDALSLEFLPTMLITEIWDWRKRQLGILFKVF